MSKWVFPVSAAIVLGGGCTMKDDLSDFGCSQMVTSCRMVYSGFYGYQRECSTACADQFAGFQRGQGDDDDDDDDRGRDDAAESEAGAADEAMSAAAPTALSERDLGAAAVPDMTRYSAFDSPCVRDSQCGPGKCMDGNCYYGCQSDAQCGSGDRCSVESGVRVCLPDPNPPVECTRSAQCDDGFTCLNGGCRQTCSSTEQCDNLLDRCGSGICLPDRRPLGECVVNSECDEGLVCLDGACVPACPADQEGTGVCLAEPTPGAPATEGPAPIEPETPAQPEQPTDESSEEGNDDPASEDGDEPPSDDEDDTPSDEDSTDSDQPDDEPDEPPSDDTTPDAGAPLPIIQ
jgi:hypothetical protein